MVEASKKLNNLLAEFLICEIGSKALDGITYSLVLKNKNDRNLYERYMSICEEAKKCGYTPNEIFRAYEVANGYIFDMDLRAAKEITIKLAKAVKDTDKNSGIEIGNGNLIGDRPEHRRKNDMLGLAKYVKKEFDSGNNEVEVALFSRNSVPRITISGKDPQGNFISVKYNAYAIRHWDIEVINEKMLIPAGIRIARIEPYEVLPSKTGVKFVLYLESV